jgi:hypothetical protein
MSLLDVGTGSVTRLVTGALPQSFDDMIAIDNDPGCALGLDDLVLVFGDYRLRKVAVTVGGLRRERNLHWLGGTWHEYEDEVRPERKDFSLPTAFCRSRVG